MSIKIKLELKLYDPNFYKQPPHKTAQQDQNIMTYLTNVLIAVPITERKNIQITTANLEKHKYTDIEQIIDLYKKHKNVKIFYEGNSIPEQEYIPCKN